MSSNPVDDENPEITQQDREQAAEELRKYYGKTLEKEEKARVRQLEKTNVDKKRRDVQAVREFKTRVKRAKDEELETKSKLDLSLPKKELERRKFLQEILEKKDSGRKKLRKIVSKVEKVDRDFSIILASIPISVLTEKIEEIFSQNIKDSLSHLEAVILEDEELLNTYENYKQTVNRRIILENIMDEDDKEKRAKLVENVAEKDSQLYPYLKTLQNKKILRKTINDFSEDDTTESIIEFLETKFSEDADLSSEYEAVKSQMKPETKEAKKERVGTKKLEDSMEEVYLQDIAKRKKFKPLSVKQERQAEIGNCMITEMGKKWINNYDSTWIAPSSDLLVLKEEYIKKLIFGSGYTGGITLAVQNGVVGLQVVTLTDGKQVQNLTYEGKTYFQPSAIYDKLVCDPLNNLRQEGDILKVIKREQTDNKFEEKTVEQFRVIHILKNGRVLKQDEALFKKELEYKLFLSKNLVKIKNHVLTNYFINNDTANIVKDIVKEELVRYNINLDEKYVEAVVANLVSSSDNDKSIEFLLRKAAKVLMFLDNSLLGKNFNFRNRFVNRFYLANNLFSLKFSDLAPEVYFNTRIGISENKNISGQFNYFIGFKLEELAISFINKITTLTNIRFDRKPNDFPYDLTIENCENSRAKDIPFYMYFPYVENSKQYCIFIPDMTVDINSFTGNKFSPKFMELLQNLDMEEVHSHTDKIMFGQVESEEETEESVEENKQTRVDDNLEEYNELDKLILSEALSELESLEMSLVEKEEQKDKCEYCKKHVKQDLYKTIIKRSGDYYENVKFCDLACFEEWSPKNK